MKSIPIGYKISTINKIVSANGIFSDGDWIESKDQDPEGDVKLIQLADINDGDFRWNSKRYLTSKKATDLNCTYLKKGDILIARMPDPLGRACIFPGAAQKCVTAVDICILRPENPNINLKWLVYSINSSVIRKQINQMARGTTRKRITRTDLGKIRLFVPPIHIQNETVKILDQADALRRLRARADVETQKLLQSMFYEMFGDPVRNEKGWEIMPFGEIAIIQMGQSPPGTSYNKEGDGLPLLNGPEEFQDKYPDTIQYTTHPTKLCNKGDILFCVRGATAGRMNFADKIYCIGRGLAAIREIPEKSVIQYLYEFLLLNYDNFQKTGRGSTFINIAREDLSTLKIPLPPLSLQKKFALFVDKLDIIRELGTDSREEIQYLFDGLMTKAFAGELT